MKFIGDFHIHSHFSLATSKQLSPEHLDYWAKIKGISLVGTGDFTHPKWIAELKEKTEQAEQGLYKLKNEYIIANNPAQQIDVRFLLTAEISSIYKKNGKVRKVHNIIFAPDFDVVEKIRTELLKYKFNLSSDGRPIIGMDSRDLLEICLNASDKILFVPAHIWTPWFSVLGSKSGFDTVEECFGDLSNHIYAVETGLSSDAPLNWMCSILDKYTLLSNSDAHSPDKLGRNANVFNTELNYDAVIDAIKTGNPDKFLGTIDMYPQEGKYHYDGHRKCNVCWSPVETLKNQGICPVCNKNVVIGVTYRITELADRTNILERPNRLPFHYAIPLKEMLGEIAQVSATSKSLEKTYHSIIAKTGSEFNTLLHLPIEEVKKAAGDLVAEAVRRMREGEVYIQEGYDGEYGVIKVYKEDELKSFGMKKALFSLSVDKFEHAIPKRQLLNFNLAEFRQLQITHTIKKAQNDESDSKEIGRVSTLNKDQQRAVEHFTKPALVVAGPGTGKTKVLTQRIVHLVQRKNILPENILAVTFTNKAAQEMYERLALVFDEFALSNLKVTTFHALGYDILKANIDKLRSSSDFIIIDEDEQKKVLQMCGIKKNQCKEAHSVIENIKWNLLDIENIESETEKNLFVEYQKILFKENLFDFDDLIYETVCLLKKNNELLEEYRKRYQWILVDEYQDINFSQYEFIKLFAPDSDSNLFVIGDPNQSIYSFRGADMKFINKMINEYQATTYNLSKSYRCTDNILKASGNIIAENNENKSLLKGINKGIKLKISQHFTDNSEAEFIARTIENMIGGLRFFSMDSKVADGEKSGEIESLSDFVILCRTRAILPAMEKALNNHAIPYQIVGEETFYKQKTIKTILNAIKYLNKPDNAFLNQIIDKNEINIEQLKSINIQQSVYEIIQEIVNQKIIPISENEEYLVKKLEDVSKEFHSDIDGFIKNSQLTTDADEYNAKTEKVTLMTLHASKGLEFNCVFIMGCDDKLLPYSIFDRITDEEEEKRLLYVGMTRAKKYLYLTHAQKRFIRSIEFDMKKSHFIEKIEKELFEIPKLDFKKKKDDTQLSLFI